jgi:hypothetical protein
MYRASDVKTEMRKLTSSKAVYAAAGAGVMAGQALRELPGRLTRRGTWSPVTLLPGRATGYAKAASAKAERGYDMLADRGKKALSGQEHTAPGNAALNGTPNSGGKGKAPSRTRASN